MVDRMLRLIILLNLFLTFNIYGQDITPMGKFLADSTKIGQPVKFSLSISHSPQTQIIFPDSGYNFFPFEFIQKEYFPTKTSGNVSFDSAVYTLRTFNIDSTQFISLPIFVVNEGDSTAYFAPNDTIYLNQYLPEIPISLDLQQQTDINPVKQEFDYPYAIAYASTVILIILIIYFIFGKAIKRRYNLFKIRSDHISFEKTFSKLQKTFTESKKTYTIEQALSIWKSYLSRLENRPIYTYTSTELTYLYDKDELKNVLNVIDRAIYGGVISDETAKALTTLKRFSTRQYHRRKREIKNA